jgi:hypothetical protein
MFFSKDGIMPQRFLSVSSHWSKFKMQEAFLVRFFLLLRERLYPIVIVDSQHDEQRENYF